MSDTPGPLPPPPRQSHGCLWGCLIAAGIVVAFVVGGIGYMGWFMSNGFKDDAQIHAILDAMNANATARDVLGDHIALESLGSVSIEDTLATGKTMRVTATVAGSKAEGQIDATVRTQNGRTEILILMLHAPDGRTYDVAHGDGTPPGSI